MQADFSHLDVVIADDVERMRALLRGLLEALGVARIRETADGEAAFAAIRERAPDLLITDYGMHPVNGAELIRLVRRHEDSPDRFLPVIMVTAYSDGELLGLARDAGANEILRKPVSPAALLAHMVAVLDNPRPFIRTREYFGPERRRRDDAVVNERRLSTAGA